MYSTVQYIKYGLLYKILFQLHKETNTVKCSIVCVHAKGTVVYVYSSSLVLRSRSYHVVEPMGVQGITSEDPTAL
jgi:hypothetical protein